MAAAVSDSIGSLLVETDIVDVDVGHAVRTGARGNVELPSESVNLVGSIVVHGASLMTLGPESGLFIVVAYGA
jgi:hypothetical protein